MSIVARIIEAVQDKRPSWALTPKESKILLESLIDSSDAVGVVLEKSSAIERNKMMHKLLVRSLHKKDTRTGY